MDGRYLVATLAIFLFMSLTETVSGSQRRLFLEDLIHVAEKYKKEECILCDCFQECHANSFHLNEKDLCRNYHDYNCSNVDRCTCCNDLRLGVFEACHNGGTCHNDGDGHYRCICPPGVNGTNCEHKATHQTTATHQPVKDYCAPRPCFNLGKCTNHPDKYLCECTAGWTGENCKEASQSNLVSQYSTVTVFPQTTGNQPSTLSQPNTMDHCAGNPCFNNDVDKCVLYKPCKNGGTCINTPGYPICQCSHGWSGGQCQTDIDECLTPNACQNGGTCTNAIGSYSCQCNSGFTGALCETEFPKCNHTCALDAVILSKAVGDVNHTCADGVHFSDDILTKTCCNITDTGRLGKAQPQNVCADGQIPPYTPIAAFNDTTQVAQSSGIFYGCIKNGQSGFLFETMLTEMKVFLVTWVTVTLLTMTASTGNPGACIPSCVNGGTCVHHGNQQYKCICLPGWTGHDCSVDINECVSNNLCQNGGSCLNINGSYLCTCVKGSTGVRCETYIDECLPNPCHNGGTCNHAAGHYNCQCSKGWTGDSCQTDIDECLPNNTCQNGGSCINVLGSYRCDCSKGWADDACQTDIDECLPNNTCQNGGSCINVPGSYRCDCSKGWTDDACQTDIDECLSNNTCPYGGICVNFPGSYACICVNGLKVVHCETDIDECQSAVFCGNGGTCTNSPGSYKCKCTNGWSGERCETDIDECLSNNRCKNGGSCVNIPGSYACICLNGTSGVNCETYTDPCLFLKPCLHEGTCSYTKGHLSCNCTSGWTDRQCQSDIDECLMANPCQHGGTCSNLAGDYNCQCPSGWTDHDCQTDVDECLPNNTCQNGATCINVPGSYMCGCSKGWSADTCQTDIDECLSANLCQNNGTCTNSPGSYSCICPDGWSGESCLIDMSPKCNHTCSLDAVILSKPVVNSTATNCKETGIYAPNDALPIACCRIRSSGEWQKNNTVQENNVCIDGRIPPYTPIAAYSGDSLTNDTAGIFYGCIKNGTTGFMLIRQDCSTLPQLLNIDQSSTTNPNCFFVIY